MPDPEDAQNESDEITQAGDGLEVEGELEVDPSRLETETTVTEDDDGNTIVQRDTRAKRSAAFAEVADRPKRKALDDEKRKGDIEFYDDLRKFDPELAGTIRAQSQSAASGLGVTHPAVEGERTDMSEIERKITDACRDLVDELGLREEGTTYFRNAVVHGNDVSHVEYEEVDADEEGGVTNLTPLPLRLLTIVDESTAEDGFANSVKANSGKEDYDKLITSGDYYVLSEENEDARQPFPSHDILHIALNRRGNWYKDRLGRMTYNVWGEGRLEPVKYAVQTKQNTLANKVAMDDKLLTREYYKIKVEELYGHIEDPDRRQEEVEEYAADLRKKLEDLEADQKPIIPEEVEVEIKGPQGETARNMADFIQTMNDSIQHALTYHVASFGRDAGGTDRGNKPAKDMSDNTVRQLRDVVKTSFRELFKIHAMLRFEDAREVVNEEYDDVRRYELADDIVLPTLTFDPVDPEDRNDEVRNAATLYEKGIADHNEARAEAKLPPIGEDERDNRMWHPEKNPTTYEEDLEQQEMENQDDTTETDGQRESPNDEPTESRPSRRTNASENGGGDE